MSEASAPESAGQTFLIGDTLYLRGLEARDAKRAAAWRLSPFPVPVARAEEILKEDIAPQAEHERLRLIACRIADDEPVGAVDLRGWGGRNAYVSPWADPGFGPGGAAVKAEVLRIVVPWLSGERIVMAVFAWINSGEPPVTATASALGMRTAATVREAIWCDGARQDGLLYELLHPDWVDRLGDPRAATLSASDGVASSSSLPRRRVAVAPVPRNAVMTGERVYLRPIEVADWERIAPWTRQESETFFRTGRWIGSPLVSGHHIRRMAKSDPPSDIEFAVCLRDGDELIGEVGIYEIDWVHRTAETGSYLYRAQHRGGGLGSEAKGLLLDYAFDRVGLHGVRSFVWSGNSRSAAALRKQGYRDAGRLCWTNVSAGAFTDTLVFDLLASEWRS